LNVIYIIKPLDISIDYSYYFNTIVIIICLAITILWKKI